MEASPSTGTTSAQTAARQDEHDAAVGIAPATTGPVVDMEVFGQLLEIDDDEEHDFSKTLAIDYIGQAETTFAEIEEALDAKDLDALSRKGHFLKGSSAALGLHHVQHSCELMQHYGKCKDGSGEGADLTEEVALRKCRALLKRLRIEQDEAKAWLENFYKV
ncbi:BQ2448_240 [Microbotryum intermedium]|uniref:BQ2448_240 protein n=1 Tax=Microbotryum intermedium TaxID=269621 RepID=A0A238F5U5_9BASI|nr:BQ2448_240 [Microbotryum intermedium]